MSDERLPNRRLEEEIYKAWVSRYPSLRVVDLLEGMGIKANVIGHDKVSLHIDDVMTLIRRSRRSDK